MFSEENSDANTEEALVHTDAGTYSVTKKMETKESSSAMLGRAEWLP